MDRVLQHLPDCQIQFVSDVANRNGVEYDDEANNFLLGQQNAEQLEFVRLCANRHTVVQRVEALIKRRGGAAARVLLDDLQAAQESERLLYAMLTPAELISSGTGSTATGSGPVDVVSDFGLPVSLMRCLLEVGQLQAELAANLAELLVSIDKGDYPVKLQVNYTKLILSQFRYLPLAEESTNQMESILFDIIEAASLDAKRDVVALLPELFTHATDSLCQKLRSLLVTASELDDSNEAPPLTPAIFDCLTLLPLSESQLTGFRNVALQLLASARNSLAIPVLLRFLLDNPPPDSLGAVDFLLKIRDRLDMLAVPSEQQQLQQQQQQQQQNKQPKWMTSTQQGGSQYPGDMGAGSLGGYSFNVSCIPPMSSGFLPTDCSPVAAAAAAASAGNSETAETLLCELILRKLSASLQLADHWLQAIESINTKEQQRQQEQQQQQQRVADSLHLVDLLVLTAAYAAARRTGGGGGGVGGGGRTAPRNSRRRRVAVLRLTRSLIGSGHLPENCGANLRIHHQSLARNMAEQLVDLLDGLAVPESSNGIEDVGQRWSRSVSADLFGCIGAHWQQTMVGSLLSRLGTEPNHSLQCLVDIADMWPTELANFAALLRAALDVLHQLTPSQARLLYSTLARLAYRGQGGGRQALQDDLCILVRKQLWHSRPMYQSYGVLGALAMLQCITPSDQVQQRHLLLSQQLQPFSQQQSFNRNETEEVKSAVSLVNLVRKACTQAPHVSLLFLDELAGLLESGRLHAKVSAWLAEIAKKDFFDSYTASTAAETKLEEAIGEDSRQPRMGLGQSSAQMAVAIDSVPTRRLPCLAAHLRLLSACVPLRGIAGLALCPLMMPHPALCSPPVLLAAANWCTQIANSFASSADFESVVLDRLRRSVELHADFVSALGGCGSSGVRNCWEQPIPLAQLDGTAVTHVTLRWQTQPSSSSAAKRRKLSAKTSTSKKRRRQNPDDDNIDNDDNHSLDDDHNDNEEIGIGYFDANDSVAAAAAAAVTAVVEDLATMGEQKRERQRVGNTASAAVSNKLVNLDQLGPCYRRLADNVFQLMNKWTDEQMGEPLILHLLEDLQRRSLTLILTDSRDFNFLGHHRPAGKFGSKKTSPSSFNEETVVAFLSTISQLSTRLVGLLFKAAEPHQPAVEKTTNNNKSGAVTAADNNDDQSKDVIDDAEADVSSKSVLDSSCSGRIVQLTMSILSLAVCKLSTHDKFKRLLQSVLVALAEKHPSGEASLATVANQAAACVGRLIPTACPTLETALDALALCRCILGAPHSDILAWSADVLAHRWDVKKRDHLAKVYRLHVEAAGPNKCPALIGRLLTNHIKPVAAGVSASVESADDPDAVCPSLTRVSLPDAFAQLFGDLARHCQANCGLQQQNGVGSNDVSISDESDQQLLMRSWPESLAALHAALEVLRAWPDCVRMQAISLRHGRALVEAFIRHGLPLLGRQFRLRSEPTVRLLKQLQVSTRQLQAVANTCKDRNDGPTSALVPPLRRTLEAFIYRVRSLVARHNCAAAFEPGQLKLKNIQGEEMAEIRQQDEHDVSSTSDDEDEEEDADGEGDYGDSDAAADDCGNEEDD